MTGTAVNYAKRVYKQPDDFETLKAWHEDHANLQVWIWGFQDELRAYFEAFPEAPRPRWFVEVDNYPGRFNEPDDNS